MTDQLKQLEKNTDLTFRIAEIGDIEDILDAFYRHQLVEGPLFHAAGVTVPDVVPVATSWLHHMIPQRLTMLALDGDKIVGMAMGEDFSNPWSSAGVDITPAMAPCVALLDQISHDYYEAHKPPPRHTLNLVVLKVRKDYSGRHVSKTFIINGIPILRERGFKKLIGILSGPTSQHLARDRFGMKVEAEIKYGAFEFEGKKPFAGITGTDGMKLMGLKVAD